MDFNNILIVVLLQIAFVFCQELGSNEAGKTSKLLNEKACKFENGFSIPLI